jgi:hypothetical protein
LPTPTAKKVLQLVKKAWKSFFAASNDWKSHPEKYFQQPRIPKYKPKNGQFQIAFEKKQNGSENDQIPTNYSSNISTT